MANTRVERYVKVTKLYIKISGFTLKKKKSKKCFLQERKKNVTSGVRPDCFGSEIGYLLLCDLRKPHNLSVPYFLRVDNNSVWPTEPRRELSESVAIGFKAQRRPPTLASVPVSPCHQVTTDSPPALRSQRLPQLAVEPP